MWHDLRYAFRTLAKSPGFASVAILALALGIGANTAIFSVVNAVLLKPLPYRDAGRLVLIQGAHPQGIYRLVRRFASGCHRYRPAHALARSGAGFEGQQVNFAAGNAEPVRLTGARISASLIPTLSVSSTPGRAFTAQEDVAGHRVVVLSYGLWHGRFGGDLNVTGRRVLLDSQPYTVIGVMPRQFVFPPRGTPHTLAEPAGYWVPLSFTKDELADFVDDFDFGVVAHQGRRAGGAGSRRYDCGGAPDRG